ARVAAKIAFSKGSIQGEVIDQAFRVGGQELMLADVRSIETGGSGKATRHDGTAADGSISGLEKTRVDLGGYVVELDWSRATHLTLEKPSKPAPTLAYSVLVKYDNSATHRVDGRLGIGGRGAEAGGTAAFVPYKGERQSIELPDLVSDVVVGR